jgi:hypothetical protein
MPASVESPNGTFETRITETRIGIARFRRFWTSDLVSTSASRAVTIQIKGTIFDVFSVWKKRLGSNPMDVEKRIAHAIIPNEVGI